MSEHDGFEILFEASPVVDINVVKKTLVQTISNLDSESQGTIYRTLAGENYQIELKKCDEMWNKLERELYNLKSIKYKLEDVLNKIERYQKCLEYEEYEAIEEEYQKEYQRTIKEYQKAIEKCRKVAIKHISAEEKVYRVIKYQAKYKNNIHTNKIAAGVGFPFLFNFMAAGAVGGAIAGGAIGGGAIRGVAGTGKTDYISRNINLADIEKEEIIDDAIINLFSHENRIALAKGKATKIEQSEKENTDFDFYDIPFLCILHPHPLCRFNWARLLVDLSMTEDARIVDLFPDEVIGDKPVELTTKVGIGGKFDILSTVVSPEISADYEKKRTLYYPKVVSSGKGFKKAWWDFLSLPNDYLHTNGELHLLVRIPHNKSIKVHFGLKAEIRFSGILKAIPILVRYGKIDKLYDLV